MPAIMSPLIHPNGLSSSSSSSSTATTNGHPTTNGLHSPTTNGRSVNGHHPHHPHSPTTAKKPSIDGFGTRAIHVGSEPSEETGAVIPAISLSTTYKQNGVGIHKGFEYSRSGNPNRNALESTLASLESGGAHALTFSSGSAATSTLLQSLGPNAHIISVNDVYGGTFRYMTKVAKENQGLETTFMDLENAEDEEVREAIRPDTKLIWIESPTNPTLRLIDISRIARIAHSHPSHPLILVDNTFLSPFYSSPFLLGADIILHSLTKYINGHSDVVMGALILPPQPQQQAQHHKGLLEKLRFLQNASGAVPSAYDCWLVQRGIKTLHLRMKQHGLNALMVAKALQQMQQQKMGGYVEEVIYPGLKTHPRYALAVKSLSPHAKKFIGGLDDGETLEDGIPFGGMVSFRLRSPTPSPSSPTPSPSSKFLTSTTLFTLAESLGGVESLAELPTQMTHASVPEKERRDLGIDEGLVRLSVGVEDGEDLVRDLGRALEVAFGGGRGGKEGEGEE